MLPDFGELYIKARQASSFKQRSPDLWSARAKAMDEASFDNGKSDNGKSSSQIEPNYLDDFAALVDLNGANSLLDMGSGPGHLTVKLSKKANLKSIIAADFSPTMLDLAAKNGANIPGFSTLNLDFYKSWPKDLKADVVTASRCLEVDDLKSALVKLLAVAQKRLYFTYFCGPSFLDPEIAALLERKISPRPDYIYAANILYELGLRFELCFLKSPSRRFLASSADEFVEKIRFSIDDLSPKEEARAKFYWQEFYRHKSKCADMDWAFFAIKLI